MAECCCATALPACNILQRTTVTCSQSSQSFRVWLRSSCLLCPLCSLPEGLWDYREVPTLTVGQAGERQSLTEQPSLGRQDKNGITRMGLGQLTAILGVLRNTSPKVLRCRTSHTSTSPPLNTTWRGYIWQIDGTSSLSNSVRGKEWHTLAMGAGAKLLQDF